MLLVQKKAVIIGSGVAGLASAVRLSLQNFRVHVFEKNDHPGGKMWHFTTKGYHFDAGPSLFTQPELLQELFAEAGEPITDYLAYSQMAISCKYFFEQGKVITAYADADLFAKELESVVGEPYKNTHSYLKESAATYNSIGSVFINYSLHKWHHLKKAPVLGAFANVRLKHVLQSLHQLNRNHFSSAEAVQLFDRFATYNGSNPYRAPGMLSLIPHLELNQGTYYPFGGMVAITNALYSLALKKGVQFHFNQEVSKITCFKSRVSGIEVNDKAIPADVVLSNMDVYYTYQQLLCNHYKAKELQKQERSSSAIVFFWGIGKSFGQLQLHNICFSNDYESEFEHIFRKGTLSDDFTIYINITAKAEPAHAPPGKENWFVMVNAPCDAGQNWDDIVSRCKAIIINKMSKILGEDIGSLIEAEEVFSPADIEKQTRCFKGALYGTSSNSAMAAFDRHANYSSKYKGLYFAGGTVHPGGGIPLCLRSAKIAADLVAHDCSAAPVKS